MSRSELTLVTVACAASSQSSRYGGLLGINTTEISFVSVRSAAISHLESISGSWNFFTSSRIVATALKSRSIGNTLITAMSFTLLSKRMLSDAAEIESINIVISFAISFLRYCKLVGV